MNDKSGKNPVKTDHELSADKGVIEERFSEAVATDLSEAVATDHLTKTLLSHEKQKHDEKTPIVDKLKRDGYSQKDDTNSGDQS